MIVEVAEANSTGNREAPAQERDGVNYRAHKKGVVLVVEDDHGDQLLTREALGASGLAQRVVVVNNGEEALQYLQRQGPYQEAAQPPRPDLILSDLNMPKVNGWQLVAGLKSDPTLRSIPIVVLSASDHPEDIAYCYSIGVNSYVRKPTDFDEFLETIRAVEHYWLRVVRPPDSC